MKTEAEQKQPTSATPQFTFNEKLAKPVELYRCDTTGRTVAFHQLANGVLLRFSATGVFISSDTRAEKIAATAADQAQSPAAPAKE